MNKKIIFSILAVVIIAGAIYFFINKRGRSSNYEPIQTQAGTIDQSSIYNSSVLHFKIYKPNDAEATETRNDQTQSDILSQLSLGRVGAAQITESSSSSKKPQIDIRVYSTKVLLEKDFSSGGDSTTDSSMASLGLKKTSVTINGQLVIIYYGDHIADWPGGGDSWPYVAAEFVGPTYAYMVELNNISNDPKNSHVMQYLNSFVAN